MISLMHKPPDFKKFYSSYTMVGQNFVRNMKYKAIRMNIAKQQLKTIFIKIISISNVCRFLV